MFCHHKKGASERVVFTEGEKIKYCPICWTERRLYSLYGRISYWWHYKVLKEPEPDLTETLMDIMPLVLTATIGLKLAEELGETIMKEKIQYRRKKLGGFRRVEKEDSELGDVER